VEGGSWVQVREALGRDERADLRVAVGEHERGQLQREKVRAGHVMVARSRTCLDDLQVGVAVGVDVVCDV
jgi:hypothetical protein